MTQFPWPDLLPGQGFFIPTLDPAKVREEGLLAAVPMKWRYNEIEATIGICRGLIGVYFRRRGSAPPAHTQSSSP